MMYIAYFTELNLQICDYAQKQRICSWNCNYGFDENFNGHFDDMVVIIWRQAEMIFFQKLYGWHGQRRFTLEIKACMMLWWSSYDVRMISKGCPDHTVTHSILYMFVIVCSSEVFERLWNPRLTPDSQDGETGRHLISPINIAHFSYFHIFHISKLLY